jgi:hypothetical protein
MTGVVRLGTKEPIARLGDIREQAAVGWVVDPVDELRDLEAGTGIEPVCEALQASA